MALSDAEFRRLQADLAFITRVSDEFILDTQDLLALEYQRAIEDVAQEVRELLAQLKEGTDGRLKTNVGATAATALEIQASVSIFERVWNRWSQRLDAMDDLALEYFRRSEGRTIGFTNTERAVMAELRGLWPDPQLQRPGSGVAGQFHAMNLTHRQGLANAVTRNVLGRATRPQLIREIAAITDRSQGQANNLFRDASIEYSRAVNWRKAGELGYKWFAYQGPQDRVTRDFCNAFVRNVLSLEEITSLNNGQTGRGTAFVGGGGFNCRHHWRGVRRSWYSDERWAAVREGVPAAVARWSE